MGPCLCGDPYCPSCGNPGLAKLEAAEEKAMEQLRDYGLTIEEYELVVTAGLAAVGYARDAVREAIRKLAESEAEARAMGDY